MKPLIYTKFDMINRSMEVVFWFVWKIRKIVILRDIGKKVYSHPYPQASPGFICPFTLFSARRCAQLPQERILSDLTDSTTGSIRLTIFYSYLTWILSWDKSNGKAVQERQVQLSIVRVSLRTACTEPRCTTHHAKQLLSLREVLIDSFLTLMPGRAIRLSFG